MSPCSSKRRQTMRLPSVREERAAVVARHVGQPLLARAVGLHDVDLGEVARVLGRAASSRGRSSVPVVGVAHRREDDPLAIGRIAAFGVVAARGRQPLHRAGLLVVRVDVHLRVVVPRVAALFARCAERELFVLQLLRFRIGVRRGELDLVGARAEERARRLADAGRDALGVAGRRGRACRSGRTDCRARARSETPAACRPATSSLRRRACLRRSAGGRGSGSRAPAAAAGGECADEEDRHQQQPRESHKVLISDSWYLGSPGIYNCLNRTIEDNVFIYGLDATKWNTFSLIPTVRTR